MTTIPASQDVAVTPGVLAAGGSALDLIGLLLTDDTRAPIGSVLQFQDQASVASYFGSSSQMAALATNYFSGFDNSTVKPGLMLAAQYPLAAVSAWLRGGNLATMTLAQLQGLNSLLALTIDGVLKSATINLATATSFSSAAQLIQAGLGIQGAACAVVTGSISGTTLTVTAVASGQLQAGGIVTGTGVAAGTYITSFAGGLGGTGTYNVSTSQTVPSQSITGKIPAVQFDSISNAFIFYSPTTGGTSTITYGSGAMATSLKLTQALGATLSQGAAAGVPSDFMDALVQQTQDFATFMTTFDPDGGSGNAQKLLFAEWDDAQNDRYGYVCWDPDLTPSTTNPASSSLGALIAAAELSGTFLIGQDATGEATADLAAIAAFVCGIGGSIDTAQANGRTTYKFRAQTGLVASCSSQAAAANLDANGYNYLGAVGTANDSFVYIRQGSVSGPFLWMDSFINQIWLNNAFQLAGLLFLTQAKSVPYNAAGRAAIEAAFADPINAALNFGAIRAGVTLSASQIAAVNAAAGASVASTLSTRGWYLQVLDATPEVRMARGTPPCKFWYMDGQSVQQIDLASINVQ